MYVVDFRPMRTVTHGHQHLTFSPAYCTDMQLQFEYDYDSAPTYPSLNDAFPRMNSIVFCVWWVWWDCRCVTTFWRTTIHCGHLRWRWRSSVVETFVLQFLVDVLESADISMRSHARATRTNTRWLSGHCSRRTWDWTAWRRCLSWESVYDEAAYRKCCGEENSTKRRRMRS